MLAWLLSAFGLVFRPSERVVSSEHEGAAGDDIGSFRNVNRVDLPGLAVDHDSDTIPIAAWSDLHWRLRDLQTCDMVYNADHERESPLWRRVAKFFQHLLTWICCGGFIDARNEVEGRDDPVQDPCSRPLQEVAEDSALLSNCRQESAGSLRKPSCASSTPQMSPQELLFSVMKKPSFSTGAQHGPSLDEETCMICLEEFSESNPKMFYECGHGAPCVCGHAANFLSARAMN